MAVKDAEQILQEEYRRLTRGGSSSAPGGLLRSVAAGGGSSPAKANGAASTPKPASAQAINQGYTLPATAASSTSEPGAGSSVAGTIGNTALKIFTSGLGVMPMISGLAGLFGGGGTPAPEPLVKYAMPPALQITAANSHGGGPLSFADYGQDGSVRSYGGNASGPNALAGNGNGGQIVVNVQAMDSRSFLDHSQEIAQAVREAMLNMHALNDVVSELSR